jgi:thioredoxin-like negative regulator of GroEL
VVLVVVGIAAAVWRPPARGVAAASVIFASRDPMLARALVAQSHEREQAGNLAAARDLLEAALTADPENAEAHYRLASLLVATDAARARAEYEATRKLDPVRYGENVARMLDRLK